MKNIHKSFCMIPTGRYNLLPFLLNVDRPCHACASVSLDFRRAGIICLLCWKTCSYDFLSQNSVTILKNNNNNTSCKMERWNVGTLATETAELQTNSQLTYILWVDFVSSVNPHNCRYNIYYLRLQVLGTLFLPTDNYNNNNTYSPVWDSQLCFPQKDYLFYLF